MTHASIRRLGNRDRQHAVSTRSPIRSRPRSPDRQHERAREAAVPTLDAMKLFALGGHADPRTCAPHVRRCGAVRRESRSGRATGREARRSARTRTRSRTGRPAASIQGRRHRLQLANLLLEREQIRAVNPTGKRHVSSRSMVGPASAICATIAGYTRIDLASIQAARLRQGVQQAERGSRSVPDSRPASPDARQQTRAHPGADAEHPVVRARGRAVPGGGGRIERATLDEREMREMLCSDGDHYYFMDTSTYEQIHISERGRSAIP